MFNFISSQEKEPVKIYLGSDGYYIVSCPSCNFIKKLDISRLKKPAKTLRAKCKCGAKFSCEIEYRQFLRKPTSLPGESVVAGTKVSSHIIVENISQQGIGFSILNTAGVSVDDLLDVTFALDNQRKTIIQKQVKVKSIRDFFLGCEFNDKNRYRTELESYLMP